MGKPPNRAERRKHLQEAYRLAHDETTAQKQQITAETASVATPATSLTERLWKFFEHPITLAALAILLGVLGLFVYTPILIACGALFVAAFRRSGVVADYPAKKRAIAYGTLICVIVPALYGCYLLVERRESSSKHDPQREGVSALQLEAIRTIDKFFAGKDEASLQAVFGVRDMVDVNIKYETDRLRHFMATKDKNFPVLPYVGDGTRQSIWDFPEPTPIRLARVSNLIQTLGWFTWR